MLSKESYELLKKVTDSPGRCIPQEENPKLAIQLERDGLLEQKLGKGCQSFAYLTDKGVAAIEEYERKNRSEQREDKSLARATWANIISALALAVSIAALIVSLRG